MSVVGNGEQPELSYIVGGSIKWYNHFGKQFLGFSKKKKKQKKQKTKTKEEKQENLYSQYGSMIPLLGIHSREIIKCTCTQKCVCE